MHKMMSVIFSSQMIRTYVFSITLFVYWTLLNVFAACCSGSSSSSFLSDTFRKLRESRRSSSNSQQQQPDLGNPAHQQQLAAAARGSSPSSATKRGKQLGNEEKRWIVQQEVNSAQITDLFINKLVAINNERWIDILLLLSCILSEYLSPWRVAGVWAYQLGNSSTAPETSEPRS